MHTAESNGVLIFLNELGILFHQRTFVIKKTKVSTENPQYSGEHFENSHKCLIIKGLLSFKFAGKRRQTLKKNPTLKIARI